MNCRVGSTASETSSACAAAHSPGNRATRSGPPPGSPTRLTTLERGFTDRELAEFGYTAYLVDAQGTLRHLWLDPREGHSQVKRDSCIPVPPRQPGQVIVTAKPSHRPPPPLIPPIPPGLHRLLPPPKIGQLVGEKPNPQLQPCAGPDCPNTITPHKGGRPAQYCSPRCRTRAHRRRHAREVK